jgi:hypothetical protein
MFLPLEDVASRPHTILDDRIHLFDVPPEAVTGIVLGARAQYPLRDDIRRIVESTATLQHVRIVEARISLRRFEVSLEKSVAPSSV